MLLISRVSGSMWEAEAETLKAVFFYVAENLRPCSLQFYCFQFSEDIPTMWFRANAHISYGPERQRPCVIFFHLLLAFTKLLCASVAEHNKDVFDLICRASDIKYFSIWVAAQYIEPLLSLSRVWVFNVKVLLWYKVLVNKAHTIYKNNIY